MKTPPSNEEIMAILYSEMATWPKVQTEATAQRGFTELSTRLINYFHVYYSVGHNQMAAAAVLPGLPGSNAH